MATASETIYYRRDNGKIYIRLNILSESRNDVLEVGCVLEKRWEVRAKLGEGSHSEVYCAYDRELQQEVAIKANTSKKRLLSEEAAILKKLEHSQYFCRLIKSPIIDSVHMLIMDMKGPCLGEIGNYYSPLSLDTVLRLSIQMIEAIEELHSIGIIHGDIKPANYVTGLPPLEMGKLFLIDFSLATKYLSDKNKLIFPEAKHSGFPGTIKYCSPVLQQTRQLCRRDDLYSMLYIMLELRAHLPWSNMVSAVDVLHLKLQMTDILLSDKIGTKMVEFKEIVRKLRYQDTPDYKHLKSILGRVMQDHKIDKDGIFEWEVNPHRIWRVLNRDDDRRRSLSRNRDRCRNNLPDNTLYPSQSRDKEAVVPEHSKKLTATAANQNNENNKSTATKKSPAKKTVAHAVPKTPSPSIFTQKPPANQPADKKTKPRDMKTGESQSSLDSSLFQTQILKKENYLYTGLICILIFGIELHRIQSIKKDFFRISHSVELVLMAPIEVY